MTINKEFYLLVLVLVASTGPDVAVLPLDALLRALALERGVLGRGALGRHGEVGLRAVLTSVSRIARAAFWTPGTCDNAVALDERR